jgi:hypothetical protein
MPPSPATQRMGELHEEYLAELNGGRKTRSSGNQWADQGDGYNHHDDPFAFNWDGKSTKGKQIAVTLGMIQTQIENAQGERPMLGLRWYGTEDLREVTADWIAVQASDWGEVLETAREAAGLRERNRELEEAIQAAATDAGSAVSQLSMASGQIQAMQEEIDQLRAQVQVQAAGPAGVQRVTRAVPDYVPGLPWVIINQQGGVTTVVRYGPDGARTEGIARTVVVERSIGHGNRPRIILDNLVVPRGSLYADGKLVARACQDDQDLEFG